MHLGWGKNIAPRLGPTPALLRRRQLDFTSWSSGLPAFGPEALIVQLAARPASFRPWGDLVAHLDQLATDCEPEKLFELLENQSLSAWQRAAYLLHRGGSIEHAKEIMRHRPPRPVSHVTLGDGSAGQFSSEFSLTDRLIAPLQEQMGKA